MSSKRVVQPRSGCAQCGRSIFRHGPNLQCPVPLVYIETTIPEGQTVSEYRKGRISSPAMVR